MTSPIGMMMHRNFVLTPARAITLQLIVVMLAACGDSSNKSVIPEPTFKTKIALGESLFSDQNLSMNRSQSCATCHNPDRAFIDDRLDANGQINAVSLGDDGTSLGDRNSPTAAYSKFSPDFHFGSRQRVSTPITEDYTGAIGGQFIDGRELNLKDQAGGPPTNPIEMGMPDKSSVVERIKENPEYVQSFKLLFGNAIFDDNERAYAAMSESIAEFEKQPEFSPFDSKYDRYLKGEYQYDPLSKSAAGKALFFSQFTNCAICHQLQPLNHTQETFTSYEYHNIGVPANQDVRLRNGKPENFIDKGLAENELLGNNLATQASNKGKFKTPTLRNVAVTEPYMHNGVFRDLKTVIQFYDQFHQGSQHTINPETGLAWRLPEVSETVARAELEKGRLLSNNDIEALVCFLRTLTDLRYESLIEKKGIECEA